MIQKTIKRTLLMFLSITAHITAQTAPLAIQPTPEVEQQNENSYSVTWDGLLNRVYFMQVSSQATPQDGFSWEYVPDIRMGSGQQLSMGFEANSENSEFFRLSYIDYFGSEDPNVLDFDGDGYTNLEEAIENTSAFDYHDHPGGGEGEEENGNSDAGNGEESSRWEYTLIHKIDSQETVYTINEDNPVPSFSYPLGDSVKSELIFSDDEGENEVVFMQVTPNPDHDPTDPLSNPHKVVGVVKLNEGNKNWSFTGAEASSEPMANLYPLEVVVPRLDNQGLEIKGQLVVAKELKVVKMKGAELIDDGTQSAPYEYLINDDRDRFYVRARDLPDDMGSISIFFETGHATLDKYRDPKTEIELEIEVDTSIYSTKSQVLFSDNHDDAHLQDSAND